jgi:hypothetical protein
MVLAPAPTVAPYWCRTALPGLECGYPESLALGVLFWLSALISIILLIRDVRKPTRRFVLLDQTILFWVFIAIWQTYRGALLVVAIHWTPPTFRIWFVSVEQMIAFIPMCLVILLLFDLLFAYRNPGTNAVFFFRVLFLLFLVLFLGMGILLCLLDSSGEEDQDADLSMSLWCACRNLVLAIFFAIPAHALLKAATYPMVQPEDACCVNFCRVGIVLYVLLYGGRTLWNATHYFGVNKVQEIMNNDISPDGRPAATARALSFVFYFLFDFVSSVLSMIAVYLFRTHELLFYENPAYHRGA